MSSLKERIELLENDLKAVPSRISVYHDLPFAILRYDPTEEWALRREAKLLATQVACEVADEAIQILGGHGYMREFPVERAWRDARLARIGAGTDEIMKEIIAKTYGL